MCIRDRYNCPDSHYLESWNDAEAKNNYFSLMQPAISQIFDTRQMADSLLKWSGSTVSYYDFIKAFWVERMMSRQSEFNDPVAFFDHVLQKGIFEPSSAGFEPEEKEVRSEWMLFNAGDIITKDNRGTNNT